MIAAGVLISLVVVLAAVVVAALIAGIAPLIVVAAIGPVLRRVALVILAAVVVVAARLILLARRAVLGLLRIAYARLVSAGRCRRFSGRGRCGGSGRLLRLLCGRSGLFPRFSCRRRFLRCRSRGIGFRFSRRLRLRALPGAFHPASVHDDVDEFTLSIFRKRFHALQLCNLAQIVQAFFLQLFSCHVAAPFKKALKKFRRQLCHLIDPVMYPIKCSIFKIILNIMPRKLEIKHPSKMLRHFIPVLS